MEATSGSPDRVPRTVLDERLRAVLSAASEVGTGVPIEQLSELLPSDSPLAPEELSSYLAEHPPLGRVVDGVAFAPSGGSLRAKGAERQARGRAYLAAARELASRDLAPVASLLECVAVTGSTAYGEPEEGDDCDLLIIARRGSVWFFLTYLYLRNRLSRRRDPPGSPPDWCANHVFDVGAATEVFGRPQGFLFAREALTAHPVFGVPYYRFLLGSSRWMRIEAPRLYARWDVEDSAAVLPSRPAPAPVRLMNFVLYPVLAAYLHAVGMVRNWRYVRDGRGEEQFRTITRFDRLRVLSRRYDRLRGEYAPGSVNARTSLGS